MKKRLFATTIVLILALALVSPAAAQDYYFAVDREVVHVYWNADGTMSVDYTWFFTNQPSGHAIEFVDVGMPNGNFSTIGPAPTAAPPPGSDPTPAGPLAGTQRGAYADVDGKPVSISSDYQGEGSYGFAVDMGAYDIQPGDTGTVHVYAGGISGVLHPDDNDQAYASAVFVPTWFGSKYVTGTTDFTLVYHLPPGVQPQEPRWHEAPSGFSAEPRTALDEEGRVTYTWYNPAADASRQYTFGASFPKSYVPSEAIYTPPPVPPISIDSDTVTGFLFFCCFGFFFVVLPAFTAYQNRNRKMKYLPPKISIEGHGIKRGLTAVEAAILMEQPLDKVMTMILFGVVKKGAAEVVKRDPLELAFAKEQPADLHQYERDFLKAFGEKTLTTKRKLLQEMTVSLVRSVSDKMKGFSLKETVDYYKSIMERAWGQVEAADTPEVKGQLFDQNLEWTMLDKDYDDRTRRVFHGPVYVPMWWGHYDPTYRPIGTSARPISTSAPSIGQGSRALPGADFAASVVTGVQTFSSKVIGNVGDFTSRVTGVTNPPPKPSTSSYRGGGGGHSCACACACAGCACACAGGGR